MAMTQRAKWMASTIADVFNVQEIEVMDVFKKAEFKPLFEDFFAGVGSSRLLVYYQTQYKITETGEVKDYGGHKEFFVSDGEKIKLKGKGVYFIRTTPQGRPMNTAASNDEGILFGEVSEHSVTSFNVIINQIYKPLVEKLTKAEWGQCNDEQQKEFLGVFDGFSGELKEALKSLQSNINLRPFDPHWENEARNIHSGKGPSQEMINDFENIFNEWSSQIQTALDGADAEKVDNRDSHPLQELEYWKQRMRKLTGISEQLRSKNCRTVYDVLTQAS
jgi:dynein heavy chain